MIEIKPVKTKREQKIFIEFPLKLYKDNPYFVPPLYGDEKAIFRPDYHYYEVADAIYLLAYRDGVPAGRISGILHHASNDKWRQRRVRFTRFDCVNDPAVAHALFQAVEDWARARGMTEVVGPLGFSDLEREGLLIEGFEELSTFEEQYNFPYYQALIEGCGYEKEVDWLEHKLFLPKQRDERMARIAKRIMERYELHMAETKSTNDFLARYSEKFFDILDETYAEVYGCVPFTDKMKKELIKSFKQILDMRFIALILDKNDDPMCFGLCFPSIGKALQKSGGRLTPSALFKILRSVKKPEILDLGLIGVVPAYRNKGVTAVLIEGIMDMLESSSVQYCETNLNLEDNYAILNHWKAFNGVLHKRRRCFVKTL